jgi:hypothetical protein
VDIVNIVSPKQGRMIERAVTLADTRLVAAVFGCALDLHPQNKNVQHPVLDIFV